LIWISNSLRSSLNSDDDARNIFLVWIMSTVFAIRIATSSGKHQEVWGVWLRGHTAEYGQALRCAFWGGAYATDRGPDRGNESGQRVEDVYDPGGGSADSGRDDPLQRFGVAADSGWSLIEVL
jgi:hypothetical protein